MNRVLIARLDGEGDVLLAGPAIRAVAASGAAVTLLTAPSGQQSAALLPGVAEVLTWPCPWTGFTPPPVEAAGTLALVEQLARRRFDAAAVLTSFHQSPLPMALLLRMAGVSRIAAVSRDYPGSLLDHRLAESPAGAEPEHEVSRNLRVVEALGCRLAEADGGRLAVRQPLPGLPPELRAASPYVVVHPSASVPARAPSAEAVWRIIAALLDAGRRVVVTGGPGERGGTGPRERTRDRRVIDLSGRTTWPELAAVLAGADCAVVGNTGPAHLAAAVGTGVVSLFAPVVDPARWAPWAVPTVLLGDQQAPCRGSRARVCPIPGHPCLDQINPADVVAAVAALAGEAAA